LKPELVDPIEWSEIIERIDNEFGSGVTKSILGKKAPIVLVKDDLKIYYLIQPGWMERVFGYEEEDFDLFDLRLMGVQLGQMSKVRFILSLQILPILKEHTQNIIIVSSRGAEAFTYGKSILKESVVKLPRHLKRGQRVIVVNEDGECLGIGALSMDAIRVNRLSPDKLVAKNLADIGWYIRRLG
jgi:ribosome biogenesis protein Nip4